MRTIVRVLVLVALLGVAGGAATVLAESVNVLANASLEGTYTLGVAEGWTGYDSGGEAADRPGWSWQAGMSYRHEQHRAGPSTTLMRNGVPVGAASQPKPSRASRFSAMPPNPISWPRVTVTLVAAAVCAVTRTISGSPAVPSGSSVNVRVSGAVTTGRFAN